MDRERLIALLKKSMAAFDPWNQDSSDAGSSRVYLNDDDEDGQGTLVFEVHERMADGTSETGYFKLVQVVREWREVS